LVLKNRLLKPVFFRPLDFLPPKMECIFQHGIESHSLKRSFQGRQRMRIPRNAYWLTGLIFLVLSGHVLADWSRFGGDKEAVFYVDPGTVMRGAGTASVWILKDFHQEQTGPSREKFRSAKVYYEFKCNEKQSRQAYLTRYYGPMGGAGSFPSDSRFHPWVPIAPGTEQAKLYELACNGAKTVVQPSN
jgi:hypothetical protein